MVIEMGKEEESGPCGWEFKGNGAGCVRGVCVCEWLGRWGNWMVFFTLSVVCGG